MSRVFKRFLVLGFVLSFSGSGFAKAHPEERPQTSPQITLRVFNYAQVSPETWSIAQQVASRIFSQSGVKTLWLDCSLSSAGTYSLPVCETLAGPTDFIVRIVPASPATREHFGDGTLGIAAQPDKGTSASASIFLNRVEELAKGGSASHAVILGHAVAHEIGHLLLGSNSHSPIGLMRAKWNRQDLQRATGGELLFTQREAAFIREDVRKRAGQQELVSSKNPTD